MSPLRLIRLRVGRPLLGRLGEGNPLIYLGLEGEGLPAPG